MEPLISRCSPCLRGNGIAGYWCPEPMVRGFSDSSKGDVRSASNSRLDMGLDAVKRGKPAEKLSAL